MGYWLLKTEPDNWSWEKQTANSGLSVWDGVKNPQGQKSLKSMSVGDLCFFYHTGNAREVVGIVRVVKPCYPDPKESSGNTKESAGKWVVVDVQEVLPLKRKVTLAQMKEDEKLKEFQLLKQPRLSIVPVPEPVWERVCELGEVETPKVVQAEEKATVTEEVETFKVTEEVESSKVPEVTQDVAQVQEAEKVVADSEEKQPPAEETQAPKGGKKSKAKVSEKPLASVGTRSSKNAEEQKKSSVTTRGRPAKKAASDAIKVPAEEKRASSRTKKTKTNGEEAKLTSAPKVVEKKTMAKGKKSSKANGAEAKEAVAKKALGVKKSPLKPKKLKTNGAVDVEKTAKAGAEAVKKVAKTRKKTKKEAADIKAVAEKDAKKPGRPRKRLAESAAQKVQKRKKTAS